MKVQSVHQGLQVMFIIIWIMHLYYMNCNELKVGLVVCMKTFGLLQWQIAGLVWYRSVSVMGKMGGNPELPQIRSVLVYESHLSGWLCHDQSQVFNIKCWCALYVQHVLACSSVCTNMCVAMCVLAQRVTLTLQHQGGFYWLISRLSIT